MLAEATKLLGALGVGVLLAFFSLRLYFRQKEYEIVKQRYLEQSLDVISGELESISSVFSHNWARCLELLKEYRDSPELFDTEKLTRGYLPLSGTQFNRTAHYRLQVLSNSEIFWQVYQMALSRHLGLNSIVANEIPHAIKAQLDGKTTATSAEMVEAMMVELKPMTEKSDHFAPLHTALLKMSRQLECEQLSFATVGNFAKKAPVMNIVKELSAFYASDINDDADAP